MNNWILIIVLLILLPFILIVAIILVTLFVATISAAPWVPVRKRDVKRMLCLAQLKAGEILYDLGSGDGRLIIAAGKDFGVKALGIEISFLLYLWSLLKIKLNKLSQTVKVEFGNFYQKSLSQADVICVFLTPWAMKRLKPKFEKELKNGCRVVSYAFSIPDWQPEKIDKPDKNSVAIFLYKR